MKVERSAGLDLDLVLHLLRMDVHIASVAYRPVPVPGPGHDGLATGRMPYRSLSRMRCEARSMRPPPHLVPFHFASSEPARQRSRNRGLAPTTRGAADQTRAHARLSGIRRAVRSHASCPATGASRACHTSGGNSRNGGGPNGIRTRVCCPPRAFHVLSSGYILLTQHRRARDSNEGGILVPGVRQRQTWGRSLPESLTPWDSTHFDVARLMVPALSELRHRYSSHSRS
jgi:hypothetical protein